MWQANCPVTRVVSHYRSTLPAILTCPYGGAESPAGVPKHTGRALPSACHIKNSRDRHTHLTTTGIAQRLLDVFGDAPYVVIAEFHWVDNQVRLPSPVRTLVPTAKRGQL
jgi:hypothetical protein